MADINQAAPNTSRMVFHAVGVSIATAIVFGAILLVGGISQFVHAFWKYTCRSRILSVMPCERPAFSATHPAHA